MYKYLEHEADIGIFAGGVNFKEVFTEGARALFDLMVDIKALKPEQTIDIEVDAEDVAALFVEWLNELLAQNEITGLFFSAFKIISIEQVNGQYYLKAIASGMKIDPDIMEVKTVVKAATYSGLKCEEKDGQFYCQCILDV
jgi:SHS2 domain-containing protein